MKKISLFLVAVFFQTIALGQSGTFNKDYHLQKSKNERTAGWVLAVAGASLIVAGIATGNNGDADQLGFGSNFDTGVVLMGCGLVAGATSVPVFMSSANHARKAAALSLNNQPVEFYNSRSTTKFQPNLTVTIFLR